MLFRRGHFARSFFTGTPDLFDRLGDLSAPFMSRYGRGKQHGSMKNIGSLIKEEFERQGHSIGWLSRQLACDRSNVYRLFQRESIDTLTLKRLCRILDHDFFNDLSLELQQEKSHPVVSVEKD